MKDIYNKYNRDGNDSPIISAGLGRIVFSNMCGGEATKDGDHLSECEQRIEDFCQGEKFDPSFSTVSKCRMGTDSFAVRQYIKSDDPACGLFVNCENQYSSAKNFPMNNLQSA